MHTLKTIGWFGICFKHAATELVLVAIIVVNATKSSPRVGGLKNKIIFFLSWLCILTTHMCFVSYTMDRICLNACLH